MTKTLSFSRSIIPAAALFCVPPVQASSSAQLIARSGDPAPSDIGGTIDYLGAPSLSISDAIALGISSSTGFTNALVRRLEVTQAFETVVASGDPLPGVEGEFFSPILQIFDSGVTQRFDSTARINAAGDIALFAIVTNPNRPGSPEVLGAYRAPASGDLQQVWRFPDPVAGIPGLDFINGGELPRISDDGAFVGVLIYNNFDGSAVLRADDAGVTSLLNTGDSVPPDGFGAGVFRDVAINRLGESAVVARASLLRMDRAGALQVAVPEFGAIPDAPVARNRFGSMALANDGTIVFDAVLLGADSIDNGGVWTESNGVVREIARENDPVPGLDAAFRFFVGTRIGSEDGVVFSAFTSRPDGSPIGDDNGRTLFFSNGVHQPFALAGEGMAAPGTVGALFDRVSINSIGINERDEYAFLATLEPGTGDTQEGVNDVGLWVRGDDGAPELLVRTGDTADVAREGEAPDVRTVTSINFDPLQSLADNGRIGYTLGFTDNTFAAYTTFIGENPDACTADFDNDGDVDMGDFGVFASAFNSTQGDDAYLPEADFNTDGDVDLGDFGAFGAQFGRSDCNK